MISKNFLDELLLKLDIADIIGSRVKLKRRGSNLIGLCPFHGEKTPSFTVSQAKQFYHCFGCNVSGNAISFIMQFERLSFVDAVERLANGLGLEVPKDKRYKKNTEETELHEVTEKVTSFFEKVLRESERAVEYLKSRGLTGEICKKFRIGYAPNGWNNLNLLWGNSNELKQKLVKVGILGMKDGRIYARLRDRIVFPIKNLKGRIIGFGGRSIDNDQVKYINSPETVLFRKGEELYGFHDVKKNCRPEEIIVVEGYLDVISLSQFGIYNVVATMGTAISQKQIQILLRDTSSIIFCFDGDSAGQKAAWRALKNSLASLIDGLKVKFLFLPDGLDPDAFIRKESKEKFVSMLAKETISLEDFFVSHISAGVDTNTIDGKLQLTRRAWEILENVPKGAIYQLLRTCVVEMTKINPEEFEIFRNKCVAVGEKQADNEIGDIIISAPIEKLVNILLHYPSLTVEADVINRLKYIIANSTMDGIELLKKIVVFLVQHPKVTTGVILEHWRNTTEESFLHKLAQKPPIIFGDDLKNELIGIISSLERLSDETEVDRLLGKLSKGNISPMERKNLQILIRDIKKNRLIK